MTQRPVFQDLPALGRWLRAQQAARATLVRFGIKTGMALPQLHQALDMMLPLVQRHSRRITRERDGYTVTAALRYREGVRLADAWKTGAADSLPEKERSALARAEALVRDAKGALPALQAALASAIAYECPKVGSSRYGEIVGAVCALTEGKANCQGVSDAMYLLGTMAGHEMACQAGWNAQGPHLWNLVHLPQGWYAMDVTYAVVHGGAEAVFLGENACRKREMRLESWAEAEELAAD